MKKTFKNIINFSSFIFIFIFYFSASLFAIEDGKNVGIPTDGHFWLQKAYTALAEDVHSFLNYVLLPVITIVVVIVLLLMLKILISYRKSVNPKAAKFSHNVTIEVIWTVIPVIMLIYIGFFSFDILTKQDVIPDGKTYDLMVADYQVVVPNEFQDSRKVKSAKHINVFSMNYGEKTKLTYKKDYEVANLGQDEVTIDFKNKYDQVRVVMGRSVDRYGDVVTAPGLNLKVDGFQWGWNYSYPEFGDVSFTANMLSKENADPKLYLFDTDNRVVLPSGVTIRLLITSADVLHSWAMPAFTLKMDAVPGRINSTWFRVPEGNEGVYFGQCSELCGQNHAFMPIAVEIVTLPEFCSWIKSKQEEFAINPNDFVDYQFICKVGNNENNETLAGQLIDSGN